jgi:hypothetical protein
MTPRFETVSILSAEHLGNIHPSQITNVLRPADN